MRRRGPGGPGRPVVAACGRGARLRHSRLAVVNGRGCLGRLRAGVVVCVERRPYRKAHSDGGVRRRDTRPSRRGWSGPTIPYIPGPSLTPSWMFGVHGICFDGRFNAPASNSESYALSLDSTIIYVPGLQASGSKNTFVVNDVLLALDAQTGTQLWNYSTDYPKDTIDTCTYGVYPLGTAYTDMHSLGTVTTMNDSVWFAVAPTNVSHMPIPGYPQSMLVALDAKSGNLKWLSNSTSLLTSNGGLFRPPPAYGATSIGYVVSSNTSHDPGSDPACNFNATCNATSICPKALATDLCCFDSAALTLSTIAGVQLGN